MEKLAVVISGSRGYTDFWDFTYALDALILPNQLRDKIRIFEGGAIGVDKLAAKYCVTRKIEHKRFEAYWDDEGRAAGILRNIRMIDEGDILIAFWDGQSKGTQHAIDYAVKKRKRTIIVRVDLNMRVIEVTGNGDYNTCQKLERWQRNLPWMSLRASILTQVMQNG